MDDTTSTPGSGAAALPPAAPEPLTSAAPALPDAVLAARNRRRILWLAVALAVLCVAGMVIWLVDVVTTARTLQAVTSSVTLPVPAPSVTPVPVPVAPALTQATPPANAPEAAPAADSAAEAPVERAPVIAEGGPARKAVKNVRPEKAARQARTSKARETARRHARKAERSGGTFARCPALGKQGAVMCRVHICNGGAGKEAACRPYLERRP